MTLTDIIDTLVQTLRLLKAEHQAIQHRLGTLEAELATLKRPGSAPAPTTPAACRVIREQCGLTQDRMGFLLGVRQSEVSRFERELSSPITPTAYMDALQRNFARAGMVKS